MKGILSMLTNKDIQLIDITLSRAHFIDPEEARFCRLTNITQTDTITTYQFRSLEPERNDMPIVQFGEKFSTSKSKFFSLKSNGDKIRIRLLGAPYVEGKHFDQNPDDTWNVTDCPRVNNREECDLCEKYFSIIAKAKKTGDEKLIKESKKEARKYQAAVNFYFPVINRDTQEFTLFKSKVSVKNQLEEELAAGTNLFESDFVVMRTETNGLVRYPVKRVDSSDTPPLTEMELEAKESYKKIDITDIVNAQRDDDGEIAVEENIVVLDSKTGDVAHEKSQKV